MNENLTDKLLDIIKETYDYDKPGLHKKKCEICGLFFDEPNDLNILSSKGPYRCPNCSAIIELKDALSEHWNKFTHAEHENNVLKRNFKKISENENEFGMKLTTYSLDESIDSFRCENRTENIESLIELLIKARKYLYFNLDPYMDVLSSFYERKDLFWYEFGNEWWYIIDSLIQTTVIKIKEYFNSDSSYCVNKIINRIRHNKTALFKKQKIISIKKFKTSGDVSETEVPKFEIDDYFTRIEKVFADYKTTIDEIAKARDEHFAHIDVSKLKEKSLENVTFHDLKRVFNSLKIIYDGFLYSIAPDKFTILHVDHNMHFSHMNDIVKFWRSNHKKGY